MGTKIDAETGAEPAMGITEVVSTTSLNRSIGSSFHDWVLTPRWAHWPTGWEQQGPKQESEQALPARRQLPKKLPCTGADGYHATDAGCVPRRALCPGGHQQDHRPSAAGVGKGSPR